MIRHVFFSFHFGNDAWRASQVRNSNIISMDAKNGYLDVAEWQKLKSSGDVTVKRWIDTQMEGTSITVVLIGHETSKRKYVKYEIEQSILKNKGLLGIYIHKLQNQKRESDNKGENPFTQYNPGYTPKVYDWIDDNGRENIGKWIDNAAKQVGR